MPIILEVLIIYILLMLLFGCFELYDFNKRTKEAIKIAKLQSTYLKILGKDTTDLDNLLNNIDKY